MKQLFLCLIGCLFVSFSIAQTNTTYRNTIVTSVSELQNGFNTQDLGFGNIEAVNPRHRYASSSLKNPALMSSTNRRWNNSLSFVSAPFTYRGSLQVAYQNERGLSYGGLITAFTIHKDFNVLNSNNQIIIVTENTLTATAGGFISKKLSEHWSIGTSLNFLYAKLIAHDLFSFIPMKTFYMDLGLNYHTTFGLKDKGLELSTGLMINNIGPKTNNFSPSNIIRHNLPTQLALAAALTYPININSFKISSTFAYQAEKLLVPTPSSIDADNNGISDYLELSAFEGMLTSFTDATYEGEEWDEINHRFGFEVLANNDKWVFGLRAGLRRENYNKGNRRGRMIGFTVGRNGYLIHGTYGKLPWKNYSISLNKQI